MHQIPSDLAIEIKDLSFAYSGNRVLSNINYSILKGSLGLVTGSNGSGKTTLLKILSTLISYQNGHIRLMGLDPQTHEEQVRSRISCGFINTRGLLPQLTVQENLLLHGQMYGMSFAQAEKSLGQLQDLLADKIFLYPAALSAGMRQIVQIAKVLMRSVDLYFLDEPFLALDPEHRKLVETHIERLTHRQATVLLSLQKSELSLMPQQSQVLCLA